MTTISGTVHKHQICLENFWKSLWQWQLFDNWDSCWGSSSWWWVFNCKRSPINLILDWSWAFSEAAEHQCLGGYFHPVMPELELPLVRKEKYQKNSGLSNGNVQGRWCSIGKRFPVPFPVSLRTPPSTGTRKPDICGYSLTKFEIGAIICIIHTCDLLHSFDAQIIFNRNNFPGFFPPLFNEFCLWQKEPNFMSANTKQKIKESVRSDEYCMHFCACCAQHQPWWIGNTSAMLSHGTPELGSLMSVPRPSHFEMGVSSHALGDQGIMGYMYMIVIHMYMIDPIDGCRCILAWEHLWKMLSM